jgi:DNA-binding MurR/RpiR family transcriptional regulator
MEKLNLPHMVTEPPAATFAALLEERGKAMSVGARRIVRFIVDSPALAIARSVAHLGSRLGTSDASVVRSAQVLGYAGLPELKRSLAASMDTEDSPAHAMGGTLADKGASGPSNARA